MSSRVAATYSTKLSVPFYQQPPNIKSHAPTNHWPRPATNVVLNAGKEPNAKRTPGAAVTTTHLYKGCDRCVRTNGDSRGCQRSLQHPRRTAFADTVSSRSKSKTPRASNKLQGMHKCTCGIATEAFQLTTQQYKPAASCQQPIAACNAAAWQLPHAAYAAHVHCTQCSVSALFAALCPCC